MDWGTPPKKGERRVAAVEEGLDPLGRVGLGKAGVRVRQAVWLRDVLGALDDQHGLGQGARIGWWPAGGVGEAAVSRQALADGLLGRAPAQHALAPGVVG